MQLGTTLFLALLLCASLQAPSETLRPSEPPGGAATGIAHSFLGDDNAPKYEVVIEQGATSKQFLSSQRDRLFPMNFNGERFLCHSPILQQQKTEEGSRKNLASNEDAINRVFLLDNVCYYRFTGWWIYELCTNKHARQFHQEQGKGVTMEFFLGYLNKKSSSSGEQLTSQQRKDMMASSYSLHVNENMPDESYASVQYVDGTVCDLSKEPRRVEVRYICPTEEKIALYLKQQQLQDPNRALSNKNVHFIESIEEPSSCSYVLKFATTALCDVSGFVKAEPDTTKIKCLRMEDEESNHEPAENSSTDSPHSSSPTDVPVTTTVLVEPKVDLVPRDAQQQMSTSPTEKHLPQEDEPEKKEN